MTKLQNCWNIKSLISVDLNSVSIQIILQLSKYLQKVYIICSTFVCATLLYAADRFISEYNYSE